MVVGEINAHVVSVWLKIACILEKSNKCFCGIMRTNRTVCWHWKSVTGTVQVDSPYANGKEWSPSLFAFRRLKDVWACSCSCMPNWTSHDWLVLVTVLNVHHSNVLFCINLSRTLSGIFYNSLFLYINVTVQKALWDWPRKKKISMSYVKEVTYPSAIFGIASYSYTKLHHSWNPFHIG